MPERFVSSLAARMRAGGARVGVGEVLNAHRALAAVPPAAAREALRASLCSSRRDLDVFERAWAELASGSPGDAALADLLESARAALPRVAVPADAPAAPRAGMPAELEPDELPAAWSTEELLLHKDFALYTEAERAAARALLARLALRGPTRRSRRTRPARRGPVHDMPRTLRASLRHGGEPFERRWRAPAVRQRPMVLAVDVSGSMAPYARMLLQYVQAAVAARRRVEAFAFGTRLTRITRELGGRDPDRALARAAAAVLDMGGGTRMGDALAELNREHGRRLGRGAVVVLLSDGWDRGDPEVLAAEMARLRRTAHRLVWLNPLAADPRYEPLTRGMQAALPHTDHLLAGNSIASLQALAELMEEIQ
ncbi:MAG TPA: VWA domain-containing protein [Solirubrobacteraceae bacterium]|nr:VWA domain-containing protein [Solirubrobacteraceae bacterium]